jgi:hypothetical protein
MDEETKTISLILPISDYNGVVERLKPLESVQDYLRKLVKKELVEVKNP